MQAVADECLTRGAADVTVETADVGDDAAVARVVTATLDRYGRLDAVVQSAGVVAYGRVEDVPVEVFDGVLRTNLLGSANLARHVVPVLRRQERGHLVLIGSVIGDIATPYMAAYAVSKWGIRALGRHLAIENRDLPDVHVSVVSPGGVDTPIYESAANYLGVPGRPPPPVTTPERVAKTVLRVLERPRDRRQVGLANNLMRGGFTLFPAVYDVLVGRLLAVAALDRTRALPAGPGSVLSTGLPRASWPAPDCGEGDPAQPLGGGAGICRAVVAPAELASSGPWGRGSIAAPPGYFGDMLLLLVGVLIVVALVVCSKPLPDQPRHRSERTSRAAAKD